MDANRFEQLLHGANPSLNEFGGFVSVVEKIPGELLWKMLNDYPQLHDILKNVVQKRLTEVVRRDNIDEALNAIITRLTQA